MEFALTSSSYLSASCLRSALIGTGFIADFHARGIANTHGVDLVGVCDANAMAAENFAATWGVPAYDSLESLLAHSRLDVLHVLTPPDTHHAIAKRALEHGIDVFLEKPMCVSSEECADLLSIAASRGRTVGVSHSLVFEGAFARLRNHIRAGDLGPLDHIAINLFMELGFVRAGPFTSWMLREPQNALLELGPHPVSALIDLVGVPDDLHVMADRDVIIPGGGRVYQRWRIHACAGRTIADINIDLGPGFQQRTIAVRGLAGTAMVDLDANTCVIDRKTTSTLDFDRHKRSRSQASQLRRQAASTLMDYILGLSKLSKRSAPYRNSLQDSITTFYSGLRDADLRDSRASGTFGQSVIETCERIATEAKLKGRAQSTRPPATGNINPSVLVLGGTGFIGRRLIKQLLSKGYSVRAFARGSSLVLDELGSSQLEIVRGDMRSADDVKRVLDGIDHVFHLATTDAKTWDQFREREIDPTIAVAQACLSHGVKRLIYTGTIDSYYAGSHAQKITEQTPLDRNINRRNYYARAKAEAERLLGEMHRKEGLPLVVVRPGIVIGEGGNPFHWGVGKWASPNVVQTWGDGNNPLPLVLVDDVAKGFVLAMEAPGIEGQSYNFVDAPMLTTREYIAAMERLIDCRIDVHVTPIWKFFVADFLKWPIKRIVGHPDGVRMPSYSDWESRTQKAMFDCSRTRKELNWSPVSDPEKIVNEGLGRSLAGWLATRGQA